MGEGGGGGDLGPPMYYGVAAVQSDGCEGGACGGKGRTEGDGLAASRTAVTAPPCLTCPAGRAERRGGGAGNFRCCAERSARRRGCCEGAPEAADDGPTREK